MRGASCLLTKRIIWVFLNSSRGFGGKKMKMVFPATPLNLPAMEHYSPGISFSGQGASLNAPGLCFWASNAQAWTVKALAGTWMMRYKLP